MLHTVDQGIDNNLNIIAKIAYHQKCLTSMIWLYNITGANLISILMVIDLFSMRKLIRKN